jgi:hypothetical protein
MVAVLKNLDVQQMFLHLLELLQKDYLEVPKKNH